MLYRINAPQVISETIDGEAIMINLGTGNYYSIRGSGAEVCSLLEHGTSIDQVVEVLVGRYEGEPRAIASAAEALIADLVREGLIVSITEGAQPRDIPVAEDTIGPFVPPTLEKYTDMQDLVLLDPVHEVDERGWPHAQAAAQSDDN